MRIAFDYRPALLGTSGIPRVARELARELGARDLDLRLFGHCLAAAKVPIPRDAQRALWRWPIAGRLQPGLSRFGIGAEHLVGGAELFHWTDYVHPPVRSARVVLTLHDCAFAHAEFHPSAQARWLEQNTRVAAARADLIVCPSQATADEAVSMLDLERDKLRVVPFGVDHVPVESRSDGPAYVLSIGTVEPRKNHARLLEAWRSLPDPKPGLVIAGRPGWAAPATLDALNEADRSGEIRWIQNADDAQLWRLLEGAAALAYPSLHEGFGFPPLEAMAAGVPVLAGDAACLREVCGTHAIFCDPLDAESIAHGLRQTIEADSAHVAAAQQHVARMTWARSAAEHEAVYREVLE